MAKQQHKPRRLALWLIGLVVLTAGAWLGSRFAASLSPGIDPAFAAAPPGEDPAWPADLERLDAQLEPIRARHRVPALALAIVRGERLAALGVVGVRRAGRPERATWSDSFRIGSDTKALTATLAACLIEEGKLHWDSSLGDLFPELRSRMRPEYASVTVEMLLHHRSGLPDDREDVQLYRNLRALRGSAQEQRLKAVALGLALPPAGIPGTSNIYSNLNYEILGAALERRGGSTWEELLRSRVFKPLGMARACFGAPNQPGQVDQPWGHALRGRWPRRLRWSEESPLPVAGGPAGDVCLPLSDWARFATFHLRGGPLLSAESLARLHQAQPEGSAFAAGWGVARMESWTELQHAGSDGWWFAAIVLDPGRDLALLAACNMGGAAGQEACDEALMAARGLVGSTPRGRRS
jgi:CubicO group peptidase (beta-lactamase class C family)